MTFSTTNGKCNWNHYSIRLCYLIGMVTSHNFSNNLEDIFNLKENSIKSLLKIKIFLYQSIYVATPTCICHYSNARNLTILLKYFSVMCLYVHIHCTFLRK